MFSSTNQPAVAGNLGKHRHAALLEQNARVRALMNNMLLDPLLPAGQARILLGISYNQMRSLVKRGVLPCWRSGPKGHMRFRLSTLQKYLEAGFREGEKLG
jgi:excisionase family DNA binding protein